MSMAGQSVPGGDATATETMGGQVQEADEAVASLAAESGVTQTSTAEVADVATVVADEKTVNAAEAVVDT